MPDKVSDADRQRARAWPYTPPTPGHGHDWGSLNCVRCHDALAAEFAEVRAEQRETDARVVDSIVLLHRGMRGAETILGEAIRKVAAAIRAGGAP